MKYSLTKSKTTCRITFISVLFFVLFLLIIGRLFYLQIFKHSFYAQLAEARHSTTEKILPERGEVFVIENKNGEEKLTAIASNQNLYLLYGIPSLIEIATSTIAEIEKVLPMSDEDRWQTYLKLNKKNDPYEPLIHGVTQLQKEKLEKIFFELYFDDKENMPIGFLKEVKRVYPQNDLFSHVIGFLGFREDERVGQYGIEEYFEEELSGEGGIFKIERDPQGRLIGLGENELSKIKNGDDVVLTLNPTIQYKVCEILKKWQEKMLAEDGTAIVVNPQDGRVLAMCNTPSFDLNNYSQVDGIEIYFNKAVNESYEPGSVIKPITMAAAIDLEKISPSTEYEDKGFLKFNKDIIHNVANKVYGMTSMTRVLEQSINTGAVFAALEIGYKNLRKYFQDFGFGKKTNITLLAESAGDISNLDRKSDIYVATASYGQGIMVTPLQLVMAYSAIANGGILMQPWIVSEIIKEDGQIQKFEAQEVRRVISSKVSNVLKAMLVSVIKNGQGYKAGVPGYYVAGKTGTANIADPRGGYSEQVNHTFVGFAPVNQPKFVILVKLSKPKNVPYSSDSVAPAFAEITDYLLKYYQIPPDF